MKRIGMSFLTASIGLVLVSATIGEAASARPPLRQHHMSKQDRSAASFMVSLVRYKIEGPYARAWESLYPSHQLVANVDAYVACQASIPSAGRLLQVRATRVTNERIQIAGFVGTFASKAVTIRVTVRVPGLWSPVVIVQSFHAIWADGKWSWILSAAQYEAFRGGVCP